MATRMQVTFDCPDPAALAPFWCAALGYVVQPPPGSYATWQDWARDQGVPEEDMNRMTALVDPAKKGPRVLLMQVPEPKTAKNRCHLDLHTDDREAKVAELVALGAAQFETFSEFGTTWTVMTDPIGNEFCVS